MWVKSNPQRFKRVTSSTGNPMWVLSSHCQANLQADINAFTALCKHLKNKDVDRTVISIQVENEPGIYGSDRDYGTEAQAAYDSPVPAGLVTAMKKPVKAGYMTSGRRPAVKQPAERGRRCSVGKPANS